MKNKKAVKNNEDEDPVYFYLEDGGKDFWHHFWNVFWVCVVIWFIWAVVTDDGVEGDEYYSTYPEISEPDFIYEPEYLKEDYIDEVNSEYPHFTNLTITFSMKGITHNQKRERMYNALEILEEQVGEFEFIEIDDYDNANIKINFPLGNNLDIIAEATPILDYEGNIEGGEIEIINIEDEGCGDYPDTEIHEILHVFMFDHNPKTIMKEYSGGCQPLHSEWSIQYVEHLKFIYSSGERGVEHSELPGMSALSFGYDEYTYCEDGWYDAIDSYEWCCQEPNMYVDSEGYCY